MMLKSRDCPALTRYARRVRAFSSLCAHDSLHFQPSAVFQLVPGAYNRVQVRVQPKLVGNRCDTYRHKFLSVNRMCIV